MGLDGFLPNPFAVVINQLSYHRRSNGLDTVSVVKDTIKKSYVKLTMVTTSKGRSQYQAATITIQEILTAP